MPIQLFGFGNKSDKRTAKVLPENLASLFGAKEGEEMVVEATEGGLKAIEAAESKLSGFNEQANELQGKADKYDALEAENKTLSEDKAKVETELATLKEITSAQHTPPQGGDANQDGDPSKKEDKASYDEEGDAVQAQAHQRWEAYEQMKTAR